MQSMPGRPGSNAIPVWTRIGLAVLTMGIVLGARAGGFQLAPTTASIPERGVVEALAVTSDAVQLTFIPPRNWRYVVQGKMQEVIFTSPDLAVAMILRVSHPVSDAGPGEVGESWREEILAELPGGRLVEEFNCFIGGTKGRGFDMESQAGGLPVRIRTCYAKLTGGVVRFQLRAPVESFPSQHARFGAMLGSVTCPAR
jgi:hypothetical protein